jgi:membrane protein DedA with SNARE-associated domain
MDPLNALITSLAAYGACGLLAIAFAERFLPIIPSTALLTTIGAAAADGVWQPWVALGATVLGSSIGLTLGFFLARSVAALGARRLLLTNNMAQGRMAGLLQAATRNRMGVALLLQLLPTARLLAPVFALSPTARHTDFYLASFVGIAIWNAAFIGAGYFAALTTHSANLTCMVISASVGIAIAQSMVAYLYSRWWSNNRASS